MIRDFELKIVFSAAKINHVRTRAQVTRELLFYAKINVSDGQFVAKTRAQGTRDWRFSSKIGVS